jgi:hypothetical protein
MNGNGLDLCPSVLGAMQTPLRQVRVVLARPTVGMYETKVTKLQHRIHLPDSRPPIPTTFVLRSKIGHAEDKTQAKPRGTRNLVGNPPR